MKSIFVVHGSTGEYSDRSEWDVVAVPTREMGEEYIAALGVQYQQIPQSMKDYHWEKEEEIKAIMSLDPNFSMDYTGTRYFLTEVRFTSSITPKE